MNGAVRSVRFDDFSKWYFALGHLFKLTPLARANDNVALVCPFYGMKYDVFLKHVIISERFVPILEYMQMTNRHIFNKKFPKGPKIWAVTERSRNNGSQFATWSQHLNSDSQEAAVEITGLYPDLPQPDSMLRIAPDFFIRRIHDAMSKLGDGFLKKATLGS